MSPLLPFPKLNSRRLMLLWLLWTVVTAVSLSIGAWVNSHLFPWGYIIRIAGEDGALLIQGFSPGIFIGVAQYAVLRWQFPSMRWCPWVIVTALGHALGSGISMALSLATEEVGYAIPPVYGPLSVYIWIYTPTGFIPGIAQAPLLWMKFKGARWWLWIPTCTLAAQFAIYVLYVVSPRTLPYLLDGAIYGILTGLALVLLLRGKSIPQAKDDVQPSCPPGPGPG